jgi:hypothetical protein
MYGTRVRVTHNIYHAYSAPEVRPPPSSDTVHPMVLTSD